MKILTLNTHSLSETNGDTKRAWTAEFIVKMKPDVVALQEVNQSIAAEIVRTDHNYKGKAIIKKDNYAYALTEEIKALGMKYEWVYIPVKVGYGKFDEGLALLSLHPIASIENILLSNTFDYTCWKKRNALGIKIHMNQKPVWCYTVHMGWWKVEEEPFLTQWERLHTHIKTKDTKVYLAGDFNAPDTIHNESYTKIIRDGYHDTYKLALNKYGHDSAKGKIDGWKDGSESGMRIDYIFCNQLVHVKNHEIVLDGTNDPIVSDHFGVLMEEE